MKIPEHITQSMSRLSESIDFKEMFSEGSNGYTFKAQHKILDRYVVVKYYHLNPGDKSSHEVTHVSNIKSEFIIPIHDAQYVNDDTAYFITDYCEGGNLDDYLKRKEGSITKSIQLISNVLSGIIDLHALNLLHRDLKPANILYGCGKALICDFGSVRKCPADKGYVISESKHSILYRPPESINHNIYSPEGDIYQIGILFYQLLGGVLPYHYESWLTAQEKETVRQISDEYEKTKYIDKIIINKIVKSKIIRKDTVRPVVPKSLVKIINKATQIDPSKRYKSASEFLSALNNAQISCNWQWRDDEYELEGITSYKIKNDLTVYKRRKGEWKRSNELSAHGSIHEIIKAIK